MQCYGDPEKLCSSVCNMWVHDERCPNFDWLGPYKSDNYVKRGGLPGRPKGFIRINNKSNKEKSMAKKNKEENIKDVSVNKIVEEEGTILVTRTTVVSGKEVDSERSSEVTKIKVRPFLHQPAYVGVKVGETIPLVQNFANRRIDVNISHPCYKEEIVSVIRDVAELANRIFEEEACKVTNAAVPRIKMADKKNKPKTTRSGGKNKKKEEEEASGYSKDASESDDSDSIEDLLDLGDDDNDTLEEGVKGEEELDDLDDLADLI